MDKLALIEIMRLRHISPWPLANHQSAGPPEVPSTVKEMFSYLQVLRPYCQEIVEEGGIKRKISDLTRSRAKSRRWFRRLPELATIKVDISARLISLMSRRDSRELLTYRTAVSALYVSSDFKIGDLEADSEIILTFILKFGTDRFTKSWKSASTILQEEIFEDQLANEPARIAIRKEVEGDEVSSRLLPIFRKRISFGLEDFEEEEKIIAKIYLASPILQSRSFPPPSRAQKEKKVESFIEGLTTKVERDEELETACSLLGASISKDVKHQIERREVEFNPRQFQTHTSLSSGASFEYTRESGGKWNTLEDEGPSSFRTFLNTKVRDLGMKLINGKVYDPYSNVLCSEKDSELPIWKIAYLETPHPSSSFGEEIKAWYKRPEESGDFASGIDNRLGRLLLVWSTVQKEAWEKSQTNR